MQTKNLTKFVFVCSTCVLFAANVYSQTQTQTQRQLNNPLDQLQPADNAVDYQVPSPKAMQGSANQEITLSIVSIVLKKVIPNADGTAIGSLQPIIDAELSERATELLNRTNNQPAYSDIQILSATMSQILRERGEILSTVYIPAQKVKNGQLELHVLQGTLGKVEVIGESAKSIDVIESVFEPYKGQVVTRAAVESQLLRIQNLLPGASALGSFRQGDRLGQSNAVIDVTDVDPFSGSLYLDNYGNDTTGELRLGTRLNINNPFGFEDRFRIDLLANETPDGFDDPSNPIDKNDYQCCFGGFSYEVFNDALTFSYGIEWSHTQYDIGNNADFQLARLGFSGESNRTRLFMNYYSELNSRFSETWTLGMSVSRSDLTARNDALGMDVLLNRDRVPEYDLGYTFTLRSDKDVYYGQITGFAETNEYLLFPLPSEWIGYSNNTQVNALGMVVQPSRAGSDENSSVRLSGDLNAVIGSLTEKVRFKGRLAFQLTDDILAPAQQFSLAGPFGVRAYPSGSFLADTGVLASVDVIVPVGPSLELSVFYDVGYGELDDVDPRAKFDATIRGAGIGLNYRYSNQLALNVTASRGLGVSDGPDGQPGPNIRNGGEEVTGRDDTQVFASVIFNF